jgi:hypothetical protein
MALGRYHRHHVLREQLLSDTLAGLPLVHKRMRQRRLGRHLAWAHTASKTGRSCQGPAVRTHATPSLATASLDLGGPAAPRAAQSLCGLAAVFLTPLRRAGGPAQPSHRSRWAGLGGRPLLGGAPRATARGRTLPSGARGCRRRPHDQNRRGGRARGRLRCTADRAAPGDYQRGI